MENLKVPYGLNDSGELVRAKNTVKQENYYCPACNVRLVLRSGNNRIEHFSHPAKSSCSIESILHKTAKSLLIHAIQKNSDNEPIKLRSFCHSCGVEFDLPLPPKTFSKASEEIKIGQYICDVVGYRGNEIALAIEVLNTHTVNEEKANKLSVHWIELKAEGVIENPFFWQPTQSNLNPTLCKSCKPEIQRIQDTANKWNVSTDLYTPIKNPALATYIADVETCFKCKEVIPIFWWYGVPFCQFEPPQPRPHTIKYKYSKKYGGSYWANTCANCHMIQGDNFLFLFDNAPFKNLPIENGNLALNEEGDVSIIGGNSPYSAFVRVIDRNF